MKADYPLLLRPCLAERVWGGSLLGQGIGEAWDLSVHPAGPSTVANGPLRGRSLADVVGDRADDFGGPLELLAKRLDAARDLSIQVHPRTGEPKTEAWVVLHAEPKAGVYHGFDDPIRRDELRAAAEDGSLPARMRFLETRAGQCVFVPSGTVHAIGAGLFLFELQQSSDVTYRLFDWGRGRELHLDEGIPCCALDGGDAITVPQPVEGGLRLVECEYFWIDRRDSNSPTPLDPGAKWTALHVIAGAAQVDDVSVRPGETLLLPRAAGTNTLAPTPTCTALVYGPR